MKRWIAWGAAGLIGIMLLLAAGVWLLLDRFDLAGLAQSRASASIGRTVTIAGLHVTPGRWLRIDLQDVHVANLPGASRPEMATLTRLTAEIEAWSLVSGPLHIRSLDVDGLSLILERIADGTPNWRKPGAPEPDPAAKEDRSGTPMINAVHVTASEITDRTSSGKDLPIRFDDLTLRAAAPDAPVQLQIRGAFRAVPVTMDAALQPIAVLRDAATPYGTDVRLASGSTTVRFQGTMTKPFAADGADGTLTLHAPDLQPLMAIAGGGGSIKAAIDLAGKLTRADTIWTLAGATGALNDGTIAASSIRFVDGGRGHPDHMDLDLAFERLDLDPLLSGSGGKGGAMTVDAEPDPSLAVKLSAARLTYDGTAATAVKLAAAVVPGQIKLDQLDLTVYGLDVKGSGLADATGKSTRLTALASLEGGDVQALRRQLGAGTLPMTGRLNARVAAEGSGSTLDAAAKGAHVSAVAWMPSGSISRDVVEKASLDIRRLFRAPAGMSPLSCALAVIDMQNGVGTITPLRIRSADGTIAGQGRFDLNRKTVDAVIGSQSSTTSGFALDVPFRISGPFSDISVRPTSGSAAPPPPNLGRLPAALAQVVRQNACLR